MPLHLTSIILLLLPFNFLTEAVDHSPPPESQPLNYHQQPLLTTTTSSPRTKRVAIIGAGSAGASSAYYLRRFAQDASIPLNITIYERASYIGGRSTTVNVHDDPSLPVELGASIFVAVNHNLVSAAKELNLSVSAKLPAKDNGPETLGVWNGEIFVFTQPLGGGRWQSWWSNAKLIYRYGLAPLRTLNLMKTVVGRFLQMYEAPYFPFKDLSQVAYDVGLTAVTSATGEQYLHENNIGDLFAQEIVQASTRVNYAQNLAQIHGLETMVCMATDGAMSVDGGNWRIFEGMIKSAGAAVFLNTSVVDIQRTEEGTFLLGTKDMNPPSSLPSQDEAYATPPTSYTPQTEAFDELILAAPFHQSSLTFTPPLSHPPDNTPYVNLHVTIFSTPHSLSPSFFNLPPSSRVPTVILTTLHPKDQAHHHHSTLRAAAPGRAAFFSISLIRTVSLPTGGTEFVYKIFSPQEVDASFLHSLLGLSAFEDQFDAAETTTPPDTIASKDITWLTRKLWLSYPYLPPRVTFERLKLDDGGGAEGGGGGGGLWYTAGIEAFISTMETSSLMGMDVAKLVVRGWVGGGGGGGRDVEGEVGSGGEGETREGKFDL